MIKIDKQEIEEYQKQIWLDKSVNVTHKRK